MFLHEPGVAQIAKLQVSVLRAELDAQVQAFRGRRFEAAHPYAMLEALDVSIREDGHVLKHPVVTTCGVHESGPF